jgi:hypothetical protein
MGGFCMAFDYQRVCMTKEEKLQKRGYEPGGSKDIYDIHQEKSLESARSINQNGLVMVFFPNSVNFGVSAQIKFQCGFGASSGGTPEILGGSHYKDLYDAVVSGFTLW